MNLTPLMLDALLRARHEPLRRTHKPGPGKPTWPAPPCTLHALVRRGFLQAGEGLNRRGYKVATWTMTDAGREALLPVVRVRRDTPRFLHRPGKNTGDYSTSRMGAIDELEAVNPAEIDGGWGSAARARHADVRDHKEGAAQITRRRRVA